MSEHALTTVLFLQDERFDTKDGLTNLIHKSELRLESIKTELCMLSAGNTKDLVPEEYKDDVLFWIKNRIDNLMEEYECETNSLFKMNLFFEEWDNVQTLLD